MIFLTFNDAHFSDQAPESRIDEDYVGTLLSKLDQVSKISKKLKATAVINAGDLFHIKTASRNSHGLIQRLSKVLRDMPRSVSIAGNHDISMDRLETLVKQPLGVLFEAGVTEHLHLKPIQFPLGDSFCQVVGLSYSPKIEDFANHNAFLKNGSRVNILVLHCSAGPTASNFYGERLFSYQELRRFFPEVDVFVIGHLHGYTGIHQVGGCWFINIGALSRCSLHLDNLERKVYVGLIEISDKGEVTCKQVALRTLPSDQVLSVEKHLRRKEEQKQIEEFMEKLREETRTTQDKDEVKVYLSNSDIPAEVREKALFLLQEAGLDA